jgi:hypothetical protein
MEGRIMKNANYRSEGGERAPKACLRSGGNAGDGTRRPTSQNAMPRFIPNIHTIAMFTVVMDIPKVTGTYRVYHFLH